MRWRLPRRSAAAFLALSLATMGCAGAPAADTGPVVVVLQSADLPDGLSVVSPGVLGLTLALADSGIRVEVRAADPSGEAARNASMDANVIAVVIAPFTLAGPAATETLAGAGVPQLTMSALDAPPSDPNAHWVRWVPDADALARRTLGAASTLAGRGCVVSEPGAWQAGFASGLVSTTGWTASTDVAGCEAVIWNGSAAGAVAVRAGFDGVLILTEQARTEGYLASTTGARRPTFGTCGCRDLSTSVVPPDQSFIHDYQLASGLDPGPYAAEGYDVGRFISAVAGGSPARDGVATAVARRATYEGVAGTYAWSSTGELAEPLVRIYRAEGARWLPLAADGDRVVRPAGADYGTTELWT